MVPHSIDEIHSHLVVDIADLTNLEIVHLPAETESKFLTIFLESSEKKKSEREISELCHLYGNKIITKCYLEVICDIL